MSKKLVLLSLIWALALISAAQGATIIWVADNLHYGSVEPNAPADQGFIDLLTAQGHEVVYKDQHDPIDGQQYWRELDPNKTAELDAADLIIIARDCASSAYDDANEAQWWNGVTTPIIMQGPHIARALPKWGWFNSTGTDAGTGVSAMQVVKPGHAIFRGVELDPNDQVDVLVAPIKSEFVKDARDAGNGIVLATRADTGLVWIATWEAGQEYYEGSSQIAGGARMFLASGAGGNKNDPVDGVYNLTSAGQTIFLNAVAYMLNKNHKIIYVTDSVDYDQDGQPDDQGWIDWLASEGYGVDARRNHWQVLDADKIAELNAADVVVMSRGVSTGNYNQAGEPDQWNGLTVPMLNLNAWMARGTNGARLKWVNNPTDVKKDGGSPPMLVAQPDHPVFAGLPVDANGLVEVLDADVGAGITSFFENLLDVGNGTLLSSCLGVYTSAWVVEWQTGVEYFDGCGQFAGGRRILFSAGTQDIIVDDVRYPQGAFNLNDSGQQLVRNIIVYLMTEQSFDVPIENPSFELPGTEKIKGWNGEGVGGTPAVDIPGWASDTAVADSGVETGYTPTDGVWTAFLMGADPSVWQTTGLAIEAGDVFELSVDARNTWQGTTLRLTLYYEDAGVRVPAASVDVAVTDTMQTFTLTFEAQSVPESVGKLIGIEFDNVTTVGDSWIGLDNVRLMCQ